MNWDMVESMVVIVEWIKYYERIYGIKEVEFFLDVILVIQEYIDLLFVRLKLLWSVDDEEEDEEEIVLLLYDDLWDMDKLKQIKKKKRKKLFLFWLEKDILFFIEEYLWEFELWQCDILMMMREEMLYFWLQLEMKIMNEGWVFYWYQWII